MGPFELVGRVYRRYADMAASQERWDRFFLGLAAQVATKSKDPSTKTGAVITTPDNVLVSVGYNGFARGVNDDPRRYANRKAKYPLVVHCEVNSLIFARRDVTGCTLYTWPFMSCASCAGIVINAGIKRCVAPPATPEQKRRWGKSLALARMAFREAGVHLDILELLPCHPSPSASA